MRDINLISDYASVDTNPYYSSAASEGSNLCLGLEDWQYSQSWVKQGLVQTFLNFQKILTRCWFPEDFNLKQ